MFLKYDDTVHPCLQLHIQLLSLLIKHRDGDKSTKSNISAIWFLTEPNGDLHSFPCFYPCLCYQFSTQCSRSALKKKERKILEQSLLCSKRFSGFLLREKSEVITIIKGALFDLGPCCLSDPTSKYTPPHCLPSNCRGLFTVLQPTRLTLLPVDVHTVLSVQGSAQISSTERPSPIFLIKATAVPNTKPSLPCPYSVFMFLQSTT